MPGIEDAEGILMLSALVMAVVVTGGWATPSPDDLRNVKLSEVIAAKVGDSLWPNWSKTPFAIDLLTNHGSAPIGLRMPHPPRLYPLQMEATFPLYDGIQTIVIGEPRYTRSQNPTRWSITLLHEHFHEWQYAQPRYQTIVSNLRLAPKNSNGMWMLDYPFPYKDPRLDAAYTAMARALAAAVQGRGTRQFARAVWRYRRARNAFHRSLRAADYRYFAFQCWQEGAARYTEFAVARAAAAAHDADPAFLSAVEAQHIRADAAFTYKRILSELTTLPLAQGQRVDFYSLGAGEALLLDRLRPDWRRLYFSDGADLSSLFSRTRTKPARARRLHN